MLYLIPIISILLGIGLDQYTKYLASTYLKVESISIIDGVFQLHYLENRGAAFGVLQNQQLFFFVIGILTLVCITYIYIRMPKCKKWMPLRICLTLMVAGAIGNMIDRIRLQYVVDFFYFELINFPIFNVADIYATLAAFGIIVLFLLYYKEQDLDELWASISFRKKETQV